MLSTAILLDSNHGGYYDNHMDEETFGQRLKRLRLAAKLSQRALAKKAGLGSHASISQAEAGLGWVGRIPSPDVTEPLARALGVPHDVLLGKTPPNQIAEGRPWFETATDEELMERAGISIAPPQLAALVEELSLHGGEHGSPILQDIEDSFPRLVRAQKKRGDPLRWFRVFGNCMHPKVDDGDWVYIDRDMPVEPGKLVGAVLYGDEAVVRLLTYNNDRYWLETLDGQPPILVTDGIRIIGRIRHRQSTFA